MRLDILNKVANKQDARFGDAVLVVGPNLTVKERSRCSTQSVADNYYDAFDIVPRGYRDLLARGRVLVTNWHVFSCRRRTRARDRPARAESDAAFVEARPRAGSRGAGSILVLNDEAHHAYRPARPLRRKSRTRSSRS